MAGCPPNGLKAAFSGEASTCHGDALRAMCRSDRFGPLLPRRWQPFRRSRHAFEGGVGDGGVVATSHPRPDRGESSPSLYPLRIVLELNIAQFQALTEYSTQHGVAGADVMRALLEQLHEDPALAQAILTRLLAPTDPLGPGDGLGNR